jgi:hypothetical protein
VHYPDWKVLPFNNPFQVHKTGHVTPGKYFRSVFYVIGNAVNAHSGRDCFFGHAEGSAKATAFIIAVQFGDADVFHGL